MKKISLLLLVVVTFSCVSKKKFLTLQDQKNEVAKELSNEKLQNEILQAKFEKIQRRVNIYNDKIASLQKNVNTLNESSDAKIETLANGAVLSKNAKAAMVETLKNVDAQKLSQAKNLKDSMNLAVNYNLQKVMRKNIDNTDQDISVDINETVVMISIADNMLFKSGSYNVSSKADAILEKLADVVNSEPSLEVMVEGHTDSRSIRTSKVADNWDLSVLRATSVVRRLKEKFNVAPEKLIAAGRSSFQPITTNDTKENRARNRRTRIVILPNIDKFFALMSTKNETVSLN